MTSRDRTLYKINLICVKYVPVLAGIADLLILILSYFDIYCRILDILAGNSVLVVIPMYISSYAYKFCSYHRMIINYIVVNKLLLLIDTSFGIPLSDLNLLVLFMIVAGVFTLITLHLHAKHGDRSTI